MTDSTTKVYVDGIEHLYSPLLQLVNFWTEDNKGGIRTGLFHPPQFLVVRIYTRFTTSDPPKHHQGQPKKKQ